MSKSMSKSFIKEVATSQEKSSSSSRGSVGVLAKYDSSFEAVPDFNVSKGNSDNNTREDMFGLNTKVPAITTQIPRIPLLSRT